MNKKPLIGWMIMEDYCEDLSHWDGVISFPNPTGANLAWQNPTKMIEYSAYEKARSALEKINHALANAQEWHISDPKDSEMDRDTQIGNWIERALDEVKSAKELIDKDYESKDSE